MRWISDVEDELIRATSSTRCTRSANDPEASTYEAASEVPAL